MMPKKMTPKAEVVEEGEHGRCRSIILKSNPVALRGPPVRRSADMDAVATSQFGL